MIHCSSISGLEIIPYGRDYPCSTWFLAIIPDLHVLGKSRYSAIRPDLLGAWDQELTLSQTLLCLSLLKRVMTSLMPLIARRTRCLPSRSMKEQTTASLSNLK